MGDFAGGGGRNMGGYGELEYKTYFPYKTLVYLNVWENVDLANRDLRVVGTQFTPYYMGPILPASLIIVRSLFISTLKMTCALL